MWAFFNSLFMLKLVTSLLFIGFCHFTFSQDLYPITDNVRQKIDSVYKGLIKKNKVMGASIAIVDKGQIVYATGYGFSDILEDKKADEKLAEKGAHHDHGKPPKQHLPEKFFGISTRWQARDTERTNGRKRRDIHNSRAHVNTQRDLQRITANFRHQTRHHR